MTKTLIQYFKQEKKYKVIKFSLNFLLSLKIILYSKSMKLLIFEWKILRLLDQQEDYLCIILKLKELDFPKVNL